MLGSILGGIASGLLGGLFGYAGASQQQSYNQANTKQQHKYNLEAMKKQQTYNKQLAAYNQQLNIKSLQTSPGALREGMENAGFNPILAYSSGSFTNASSPGSAQALGTSLPTSQAPDYAGAITNAFQKTLEARQQRNQDKLAIAQVNNTNADSQLKMTALQTEIARAANLESQTKLNLVNELLGRKDIENYERKQLREDRKVIIEEIRNQILGKQAQSAVMNAVTNASDLRYKRASQYYESANQGRIGKEIRGVLNARKDVKAEIVNFGKKYPLLKKSYDFIKGVSTPTLRAIYGRKYFK